MAGIVRHREIAMPRLRACLSALLLACAFAASATPPGFDGRAGVARVDQARIDAALSGLVDSGQIVGVSALVWQDGREAYFGAFGLADREAARPMARDTLVQIFSMTKPVTGVALMQLYEQGRFGLDDPRTRPAAKPPAAACAPGHAAPRPAPPTAPAAHWPRSAGPAPRPSRR